MVAPIMIIYVCIFIKYQNNNLHHLSFYLRSFNDKIYADIVGTIVAIGNLVNVNNVGGRKIRRTIVIKDDE